MLRIGVIGHGSRIQCMLERMEVFDIPYRVAAVGDPRWQQIKAAGHKWLEGCEYFPDGAQMIEQAGELDGIMIGTRCFMHADDAIRAARRQVPLFVEKPVAITFDQVRRLAAAFDGYKPPVVVSFPLRVTQMIKQVKHLLDQDAIGRIDQVIAFNDVPYGGGYYSGWMRDLEQTGGLWLQKATHDMDYLNHLIGRKPVGVFAMSSRRVYGGSKPNDLRCGQCQEMKTCPESSFNLFYQGLKGAKVNWEGRRCPFAKEVADHDNGSALVEYEDGLQVNYTQNFFARHKAERRGARLYGHKGTLEFDWYTDKIRLFSHRFPTASTIELAEIRQHWGGDRELSWDWLMAMKEHQPSRCPMSAGILSALMCLWARQSSQSRQYCRIEMPAE